MTFEVITFIVLYVFTFTVSIIGYGITYPFRRQSSLALRVKCKVKQFPDIMNAEYINKNGRFLSITTAYVSNPVDIGTLKETLNDLNIPCHIDKVHLGSMPSNARDTIFFGNLTDSPEYRSAEGLPLPGWAPVALIMRAVENIRI